MTSRRLILVTGAAGMIGKQLQGYLRERYRLRLMYHKTVLPAVGDDEAIIGDVCDLATVEQAVEGVDAIVHLAGDPKVDATFESVIENNIRGVYNVYEAARRHGNPRVVFASTNHVAGWYEVVKTYVTPDLPVRPDGYYGASKAFGEALGRWYHDAFGLAVICLRIGSYLDRPTNERNLSTWLSPRDMAQLTWRSIESDVPFGIFYAISGNSRRYWDIGDTQRVLGYEPEDNAEVYAPEIMASARPR
ncbi:MAG TPA: NAD(P)-dependent oxidoreductase [Chloroflexota bacterium]|nr:NAD(P)-dependent oxidoreductase [Chloroflexota bacterium]